MLGFILLIITIIIITVFIFLYTWESKFIISDYASKNRVNFTEITPEDLKTYLYNIALVPNEKFYPIENYAIVDKPTDYIIANNYTIQDYLWEKKPILINETLEQFFCLADILNDQTEEYLVLFPLSAFGSDKFFAISDRDISSLSSVSLYKFTSRQYYQVITNIGAVSKRNYYK